MIPLIDNKDVNGPDDKIDDELNNLSIASLMHDIGKFYQRANIPHNVEYRTLTQEDFGNCGAHGKWSASFIDDLGFNELIKEYVLYHHKYSILEGRDKFLTRIVSESDSISCKEREGLGHTADVDKEPLISTFSNINISDNDTKEHYHRLTKLDPKNIAFPIPSKKGTMKGWKLEPEYKTLWNELSKDVKLIHNITDPVSLNTLYYILKKYTMFIPSAAYIHYPDISLFDHSKTTLAIGRCLYDFFDEKGEKSISNKTKYFTLISGNISGIQSFIYDISSPQFAQRGMSERLRGRSLYISLLNDNLARMIVDKLELPDANILWCGGGYFLIIVPNTNRAENVLNEYERYVNEYLFKKHGNRLFLSLTYQYKTKEELDKFSSFKKKAFYDNAKNKKQKYINNLDMVFAEEESVPPDICRICGNPIIEGKVCEECINHEHIGDKITRADYIIRVVLNKNNENNDIYNKFDLKELNTGYLFLKKEHVTTEIEKIHKSSSKIQIFRLNNTEFLDIDIIKSLNDKNIKASFGFTFLGNTIPAHHKYGPLSFEQIASVSKGPKKLGILKIDIDDLGKLFEIGLGDIASISRTSTMSSLIDIFISGYINEIVSQYYIIPDVCPDCSKIVDEMFLSFMVNDHEENIKVYREKENGGKIEKVCEKCAKKKIPILYICYSGGDDIVILGPWDIIIRFTNDFRNIFKKYTCENNDINISAGIHICGHKFPMSRSMQIVNDLLHKSKLEGKDRITIFGEPIKWKSFDRFKGYEELLTFADQLEKLVKDDKLSNGFVYSLLMLYRDIFGDLKTMRQEDRINARSSRNVHTSKIRYKLRLIKDKDTRKYIDQKLVNERMLPWIEFPASIVSLKWRTR
jgi:CRISPR-associated protein Csm1